MTRKLYYWKLRQREIHLGQRTLIVGILNVTPDSFSDGGHYLDPDRAFARAVEMEEAGADIIDIGAESTRPGATPISADEEMRRLVPVLKRLKDKLGIPISVDTYKSDVAEKAIKLGAEIVNDPSGLTFDPALTKVVANTGAGLILNHMRGRPDSWAKLGSLPDPMVAITRDLQAAVRRANIALVQNSAMVVDPGLGFGKRKEENSEIIARLRTLASLDLPIMVGPSRKAFLNQTTESGKAFATAAAVTASIMNGAHMVRVHDVSAMSAVVKITDEIMSRVAVPD